jgi:hypothetical protein
VKETESDIWRSIRRLHRVREETETGWLLFSTWSVVPILSAPFFVLGFRWAAAAISTLGCVFLIRAVSNLVKLNGERREIELYLCASHEVDAVGPLAESMLTAQGRQRVAIRFALSELRDKVNVDELPAMTREQRSALNHVLVHDDDASLSVAILRAYQLLGWTDERAIVRMLDEGPQIRGRESLVVGAARRCLKTIDPVYKGSERGELLRPAAPGIETLLRPAVTSTPGREEDLLRPSEVKADQRAHVLGRNESVDGSDQDLSFVL